MGGPDPQRRERNTFNKRTRTLLGKAHELATLAGADVYLFINHPRATVTYNSVGDPNWPPADKDLVIHNLAASYSQANHAIGKHLS